MTSNDIPFAKPVYRKHKSKLPQAKRMNNPTVPIDKINECAEELRLKHPKITDRQHELVALIIHDGRTITYAAEHMKADRAWAVKTLNKQHVIDYSSELAKRMLGIHSISALNTMSNLLNSKSDKVKLEAAQDLMDRAGLHTESAIDKAPPLVINISI